MKQTSVPVADRGGFGLRWSDLLAVVPMLVFTIYTVVSVAQQSAPATTQNATVTQTNAGERKFRANCSRCHNAPEQLSPRITGTVLRHMRVRASLSAEDERDILKYLAP